MHMPVNKLGQTQVCYLLCIMYAPLTLYTQGFILTHTIDFQDKKEPINLNTLVNIGLQEYRTILM